MFLLNKIINYILSTNKISCHWGLIRIYKTILSQSWSKYHGPFVIKLVKLCRFDTLPCPRLEIKKGRELGGSNNKVKLMWVVGGGWVGYWVPTITVTV